MRIVKTAFELKLKVVFVATINIFVDSIQI